MKLELRNGQWAVVKKGEVLASFESIKDAQNFKFDATHKATKVQYWKQDGTAVRR